MNGAGAGTSETLRATTRAHGLAGAARALLAGLTGSRSAFLPGVSGSRSALLPGVSGSRSALLAGVSGSHGAVLAALALVGIASLAGGCRRRGPPTTLPADARAVVSLERHARRDLSCPEVYATRLRDEAYQIVGCGRVAEYAYVCVGRRCRWSAITEARARAVMELRCPYEEVLVRAPSPARRDLAGCGRTIAYVLRCGGTGCAWEHDDAPPDAPASMPSWAGAEASGGTRSAPAAAASDDEILVAIPPPPGAPPIATVTLDALARAAAATASEDELAIPPPPR